MSALVLAFDTATEVIAVAVGRLENDRMNVLTSCDAEAPRAAMSRLLPCIEDLLAALEVSPGEIDEVVVGRGPGSFTGVRIGVATAKGLAQGLDVPLFGVRTLDAIAWRIAQERTRVTAPGTAAAGGELLGVVGDAMRGEVYPARYRLVFGRAERLDPDAVAKPDDAALEWAEGPERLLLAGNGLHKYAERFESALAGRAEVLPEGLWSPTGSGLLAAYAALRLAGEQGSGDPSSLLPVYTRLSDAEEAERSRGSRL